VSSTVTAVRFLSLLEARRVRDQLFKTLVGSQRAYGQNTTTTVSVVLVHSSIRPNCAALLLEADRSDTGAIPTSIHEFQAVDGRRTAPPRIPHPIGPPPPWYRGRKQWTDPLSPGTLFKRQTTSFAVIRRRIPLPPLDRAVQQNHPAKGVRQSTQRENPGPWMWCQDSLSKNAHPEASTLVPGHVSL